MAAWVICTTLSQEKQILSKTALADGGIEVADLSPL